MTDIYFFKSENEEYSEKLAGLVSPKRRESLAEIRLSLDRKLSLYSELIVRTCASKKLNIDNSLLKFARSEHGKPYLLNDENFHFNISHTKDALVAAVSDENVGADIEKVRDIDCEILMRRFCENERNYIKNSENKTLSFFEIWTKKEGFVKYTGEGLVRDFSSFDVLSKGMKDGFKTLYIDSYVVSVYTGGEGDVNLTIINEREFDNMLNSL